MSLREQYFAALLASQRAERLGSTRHKQLVSKSAVDAPAIVAVRDGSGRIVGFGPAERIPSSEVERVASLGKQTVRQTVSKSVQTVPATSPHPNAIFDDLFSFCDEPDERSEVAKSAYRPSPEDTLTEGFFPPCLRSK